MSHVQPVQVGGAAVLGAAVVKGAAEGAAAAGRGAGELAATGARALHELVVVCAALAAAGAILIRRGRSLEIKAAESLD